MRTILEVSRIQQLPSQGAIVVRGTPDQVALAQKLVDDLDKAKPEVLMDVAVMEVSRDKMKTFGISPPTNVSVAAAAQRQHHHGTTGTTGTARRLRRPHVDGHQSEHIRQSQRHRFPGDDSVGERRRRC